MAARSASRASGAMQGARLIKFLADFQKADDMVAKREALRAARRFEFTLNSVEYRALRATPTVIEKILKRSSSLTRHHLWADPPRLPLEVQQYSVIPREIAEGIATMEYMLTSPHWSFAQKLQMANESPSLFQEIVSILVSQPVIGEDL